MCMHCRLPTVIPGAVRVVNAADEYLNVAAGLAVLAGIAASDAICRARLRLPIVAITTVTRRICCAARPQTTPTASAPAQVVRLHWRAAPGPKD
jgi:hypothetical protein